MAGTKLKSLVSGHLFASEDGTLHVFDIPQSIACSQQTSPQRKPCRQLYSTPVLEKPWPSLEPKSDKARANLLSQISAEAQSRNKEYAIFVRAGLDHIKQHFAGQWCSNRAIGGSPEQVESRKRKFPKSSSKDHRQSSGREVVVLVIHRLEDTGSAQQSSGRELHEMVLHNPSNKDIELVCIDEAGEDTFYLIPSSSLACQRSINEQSVLAFEMVIEQLYCDPTATAGIGQFDIVVMDPPWNNRSVRRSNQYDTMKGADENPLESLAQALPRLLASEGLLAIWITNKESSRKQALKIFQDLGIDNVEEWIWIKVTNTGEPVYDLNGLYRQPWEVCLVGKRGRPIGANQSKPSYRLIAACPDLHSRKPALGPLFMNCYNVSDADKLRKLEIFARHASAGWCAWGDDALKFNDQSHWSKTTGKDTGSSELSGQ